MKWTLSRCRRKYLSARYEVAPMNGGWRACWNPIMAPMVNAGMQNGGRFALGWYRELAAAKAACDEHARGLACNSAA